MSRPAAPFRRAAAMAALIALVGCAEPTPYQPAAANQGEGYSTQQIEANRFRISFRGNSVTSRQTVDTYMLYRCAEVTLQNGFDYFVIANKDVDKNTSYQNYGDDLAWGWGGGWGWRYAPGVYQSQTRPISTYDAIADIILRHGPKPAGDVYAYNAHEVLAAIGPTVIRIGPAPGAPLAALP